MCFNFRSCECNSNGNNTQSTTANPNRNNGNNANTPPLVFSGSGGGSASNAQATPCICGNLMNPSNIGNANAFNININNGAYNDGSATNSADTLLSSNAKFQAISAIAVSQDGVINVADQGMYLLFAFNFFVFFCIKFQCPPQLLEHPTKKKIHTERLTTHMLDLHS